MPHYSPAAIEPRWQAYWEENRTFRCPDPTNDGKPKVYLLDMFPYPSGAGLHVGHPEGYTATDILARFRRMQGYHVLHPMGWDAFGLPAEQYAIQTGTHPRITTRKNIDTFRRQIQSLGFSYDWDREVDTTDPGYVKWTQWIFLQLYDTWYDRDAKKGRPIAELPIPTDVVGEDAIRAYRDGKRLAYTAEVPVNWCPALGTVLANEEIIDGKSERGSHPVVRQPLRQWLLRITEYAERLIDDLEALDWSESIKQMQRNWIGKSVGAEVDFALPDGQAIRVYTTRPDTLFGATYMVLSPEHPLVAGITTPEQLSAVKAYQEQASRKSDFERTELAKTKTGVFTGATVTNPVNGESIPVWIADYVLAGYGTGAIMAVPAHDERDFAFAKTFNLPIRIVVKPASGIETELFADEGIACNSGTFDGLPTAEVKSQITAWLTARNLGTAKVNYKLRDWLFSRQRYWGEPFPLLHELDEAGQRTGRIDPVDVSELPVVLPELEDFRPTGSPEGPLAKATEWRFVERNGKRYQRETNTMPQWAGSCWYYLRYLDPKNETAFCDPAKAAHWLPVDLYVGGAEHAVLHLLYSRFWHKVLFDRGHLACREPFQKLVNQGMILGEPQYYLRPEIYSARMAELNAVGITGIALEVDGESLIQLPIAEDRTTREKGKTVVIGTTVEPIVRADKMSKARGNVVNPDDVVKEYGADALRLYEMFMGPLEASKPWNMRSVEGVYRFLSRVWRLIVDDTVPEMKLHPSLTDGELDRETLRTLHKTIRKVTEDTDGLRFNTAIAAMMEFVNVLTASADGRKRMAIEPLVLILAPYAPHVAEELWSVLGHSQSLAYAPWPKFDPTLTEDDTIEVPVQINGKVRAKILVPTATDAAGLEALARADAKIAEQLAGKTVRKVVAVPKKLVNFVVA